MHGLLTLASTAAFATHSNLAQFSIAGLWDSVWPYALMLAGFSLIVFVHELGHFAVAKWADVRVEKFAVGFGREVFGFTRGETRYSFNILPLGGYVKMLGQEDFDDKADELRFNDDPRSFVNKSVGTRAAIVSAGVIMNLIFACLLFGVVFMFGMEARTPRLAVIEHDSPAEKAGLLPGDIIRSINGKTILEFDEVRYAVLLSQPHEPIEVIVERDGELLPPFFITPDYRSPDNTRGMQRQVIGIRPGMTREIRAVGPEINPHRRDHPHIGDLLVEVGGVEVTDENASAIYGTLGYATGEIIVERSDPDHPDEPAKRVAVRIPPLLSLYRSDRSDPRSASVLGLTPLAKFYGVDERGRAYLGGLKVGDTVLRWDDQPHPSMADIALSVHDNAERDIPYRVRRADGTTVNGFVRPKRHKKGLATIQAVFKSVEGAKDSAPRARFDSVRSGGIAAKAGIEAGDLVVRIGSDSRPLSSAINEVVRQGRGREIALTVRRKNGHELSVVVVPQAPGSIDASFTMVADEVMHIGGIVETIHGRPSPAAEAGIPPGATIVAINDYGVLRWRDLISTFRQKAGTTVSLTYLDEAQHKKTVPFRIPHSLRTLLGIGPEGRILKIDGRDSVSVADGRGGLEVLSVRHRVGTREVLSQLVGQTEVPIVYRAHPFADLETAYIDVTEDMLDPWLARVAFFPNVSVAAETILLKGENVLDAVMIGIHKTYYFILQVYTIMERMIFTRSMGLESMSGPLGIFNMGGQVARADMVKFLFFMAMISANLAVINFLPLPIVDGGLMVFLIIEKIKGSPVSLRVQVATQMIGVFFLLSVFVFVTYQDALRMM